MLFNGRKRIYIIQGVNFTEEFNAVWLLWFLVVERARRGDFSGKIQGLNSGTLLQCLWNSVSKLILEMTHPIINTIVQCWQSRLWHLHTVMLSSTKTLAEYPTQKSKSEFWGRCFRHTEDPGLYWMTSKPVCKESGRTNCICNSMVSVTVSLRAELKHPGEMGSTD